MSPVRIQRRRTKGWRMPEGAVYVGRPSRWGNPYSVSMLRGAHPARWVDYQKLSVSMFREWLRYPKLRPLPHPDLVPLRGHDLACWCPLDQPCHADVLLDLANQAAVPA